MLYKSNCYFLSFAYQVHIHCILYGNMFIYFTILKNYEIALKNILKKDNIKSIL